MSARASSAGIGDGARERAERVERLAEQVDAGERDRAAVGLNPTTPQYAAGRITEPLVCVPIAAGTCPAATAAAEPDDEPPGVCARSTDCASCRDP